MATVGFKGLIMSTTRRLFFDLIWPHV